jgi:ribosomal protein L11 methyltransferase
MENPLIALDTQGIHPSTAGCLEALGWLHERIAPARVLDMGCGNGILAATAALLWDAPVLAADISPKALEDAATRLSAQGLSERVQLVRSDGFSAPLIRQQAPYGLIIANLLAELQLSLAAEMKKHLAPGGHLLLSGVLRWKLAEVQAAFSSLNIEFIHEIEHSPWVSVVALSRD